VEDLDLSKTLMIMKPDVLKRQVAGKVLAMVEDAGFGVRRMEVVQLTEERARKFYSVHEGKPFLEDLVSYMISGPCIPLVLEKDNAVLANRELMGATNPENADEGTIRKAVGIDIGTNSVHGSDSDENAAGEIEFFFPGEGA
jgi:nucleoside-diphosphate kinase